MADKEQQNPLIGTEIKAVPKEHPELGIDTSDALLDNIISQAIVSNVDISKLEGFSNVAQTREQTYKLIDTMAQDPILSSYLKTLAEDAVEPNDQGRIIWCESADSKIAKYVTYLLDSFNVDKHAFHWAHSLIKYGDLYLQLFRQSDYEDDGIFDKDAENQREYLKEEIAGSNDANKILNESKKADGEKEPLKEDVNVVVHSKDDHYVHYTEAVPNPGEMFELTKFGKTRGYVKAPIKVQSPVTNNLEYSSYLQYKLKQSDVDVYSATDFVHACLEDNSSRVPEEVDLFIEKDSGDLDTPNEEKSYTYTVKRGQSELANVFKIWRQLSLLENSAMLNRITKSSIIRTIEVEVGQMGKEQIATHLQSIKSMMETKTAIDKDNSMQDYTNPGPIENNIYVPVRNGIGKITANNIGGDFDPKQLTDLSYFQDKLFGSLGVPKAFFGITDDGAGFNGGTSLAIQSSRYGKSVKRIQNTLIQAITDLINLMLLDKGLIQYINKFQIKMQNPVTQEELDRRENKKNRMQVISDIMQQLAEMPNPILKLKVIKSLLSESLGGDTEVISIIQEQIDELEKEAEQPKEGDDNKENEGGEKPSKAPRGESGGINAPAEFGGEEPSPVETPTESEPEQIGEIETEPQGGEESYIPSPNELNLDLTQNQ